MASALAGTRAAATKRRTATTDRPRRYATLEQAAEYLVCSTRYVRDLIARGEITGYRMGSKSVRVDLNELDGTVTTIPVGGRLAATRGRADA